MKIAAALFILVIISAGLFNSYRKYKTGLLPVNFFAFHCFIGVMVVITALFLLFE